MQTVSLGRSGIEVSQLCLGCWQMGLSEWTGVEDESSLATIDRALELGINFLDTSEMYGKGHSEEIIGQALRGRRDQVVVASKVAHWNSKRDQVRGALEASLERLGTDYVDLYQVHWPWKEVRVEETLEAMAELKAEGLVRALGVCNFNLELLQRAVAVTQLDSLQPPFSIVWREIDAEVLPFCRENGISVLGYSPMAQGLILGKYNSREELPADCRSHNVLTREGVWENVLAASRLVVEIAEKLGRSPAQVALNWVLSTPGLTCALAGARRPEQIADSVGAVDFELSQEDYDRLSEAGAKAFAPIPVGETLWHWRPDGFDD